jgi:hypothetical protein
LNTDQIVSEIYQKVLQCLNERKYYVTKHARDRSANRGIVEPLKILKDALTAGEAEIIQFYWEYSMGCLKAVLFIPKPYFIHFIIMLMEQEIGIKTVYLPTEYENDGKTRKRN